MTYVPFVFAIVFGGVAAGLIGRLFGSVAERFVDPDARLQARHFYGSYLMLVNLVVGAVTAGVAWWQAGFWPSLCWAVGVAVAWPVILWAHQVIAKSVRDADSQLQERIYNSPTVALTFLLSQILTLVALVTSGRINFAKKSQQATPPANDTTTSGSGS